MSSQRGPFERDAWGLLSPSQRFGFLGSNTTSSRHADDEVFPRTSPWSSGATYVLNLHGTTTSDFPEAIKSRRLIHTYAPGSTSSLQRCVPPHTLSKRNQAEMMRPAEALTRVSAEGHTALSPLPRTLLAILEDHQNNGRQAPHATVPSINET